MSYIFPLSCRTKIKAATDVPNTYKKFNERKVHEVDLNKKITDTPVFRLVIGSVGCGAGLVHLLKSGVNSILVRRNFQRANM